MAESRGGTRGLGVDTDNGRYAETQKADSPSVVSKVGPTERYLIGGMVLGGAALISKTPELKLAASIVGGILLGKGFVSLGEELEELDMHYDDTSRRGV